MDIPPTSRPALRCPPLLTGLSKIYEDLLVTFGLPHPRPRGDQHGEASPVGPCLLSTSSISALSTTAVSYKLKVQKGIQTFIDLEIYISPSPPITTIRPSSWDKLLSPEACTATSSSSSKCYQRNCIYHCFLMRNSCGG